MSEIRFKFNPAEAQKLDRALEGKKLKPSHFAEAFVMCVDAVTLANPLRDHRVTVWTTADYGWTPNEFANAYEAAEWIRRGGNIHGEFRVTQYIEVPVGTPRSET